MISHRNLLLNAACATAFALCAGALPALAVQKEPATPAKSAMGLHQSTPNPSVIVWSQKPDGNTVVLKYAYLPKDGFVAIYGSDASGHASGEAIGTSPLAAGDHRDVKVMLKSAPREGDKLWATLYENTGKSTSFDKSDKAVWRLSDLPMQNRFKIR